MADKPTVSVPEGQTGPVVHSTPGESLDLTHLYESGVPDGPTGSTPAKPGSVRLFDDPTPPVPEPEGDTVRTSKEAALVDPGERTTPTVGELRKAGYTVSGKDGDIPTAYTADSPTPPNEVHLVEPPHNGPLHLDTVEVDGRDVHTAEGDELGTIDQPKKRPGKQVRSSPENK